MGVVQRVQDFHGHRRGAQRPVHEHELLLRPNAADAGLDAVLRDHAVEGPEVAEHGPSETAQLLRIRLEARIRFAHRSSRPRRRPEIVAVRRPRRRLRPRVGRPQEMVGVSGIDTDALARDHESVRQPTAPKGETRPV